MADILIVGGSGYIGRHLMRHLGPERAVGTYYATPFSGGVYFDPFSMSIVDLMTDGQPFSHAIILMGMTRIDPCALDPAGSHQVNVEAIGRVIRQCEVLHIKPIYTSSDVVFDGVKGHYVESDPPNPLLRYGQQKWTMERYLADLGLDHAVARLSKVFSAIPTENSLLSVWLKSMQQGDPIRLAYDRIFSPICVSDVVHGLMALVNHDLSGVFHLCGPTPASMEELFWLFKHRLDDALGTIETVNVTACSINELGFQERWPLNISMDPTKLIQAAELVFRTPASVVDEFVRALKADGQSR